MKKLLVLALAVMLTMAAFVVPIVAQAQTTSPDGGGGVVVARPGLVVRAPHSVVVGETVNIAVVDQESGRPVNRAGVWAVAFRPGIDTPVPVVNADALAGNGVFLGWTDSDGQVSHVFQEAGWYVMAAFKDGHMPGFAWTQAHLIKQLAIKAPTAGGVGDPVTFTVFEQNFRTAVPGAGLWALLADDPALANSDPATTTGDLENQAIVVKRGIFLGRTNDQGQVSYKFEKAGGYYLVAVKDGYAPGFGKITIKDPVRTPGIKAPETALVGQEVTLTVFERNTGTVVPGAGVWALLVGDLAAGTNLREDLADMAMKRGIFLGRTNDQGQVSHKFDKAGGYYLVAVKDGYAPGFGKITIKDPVRTLGIKAPETALVGQEVTVTVFESNTGTVVPGAGVWALLAGELAAGTNLREDLADIAVKRGIFLGRTNDQGQVSHKFEKAGGYYLVAVKDGYAPGFGKITVKPPVAATPVPVPQSLRPAAVRPIAVLAKSTPLIWIPEQVASK